jgi:hypothetical protein
MHGARYRWRKLSVGRRLALYLGTPLVLFFFTFGFDSRDRQQQAPASVDHSTCLRTSIVVTREQPGSGHIVFFVPVANATHYCALKVLQSASRSHAEDTVIGTSSDDVPRFTALATQRQALGNRSVTLGAHYHTPLRSECAINVLRGWLLPAPSKRTSSRVVIPPGDQLLKWTAQDLALAVRLAPGSSFVVFGSLNGLAEFWQGVDKLGHDDCNSDLFSCAISSASIQSNARAFDCDTIV